MSLYFFRGCDFCKDYFVRYINGIFLANAKGALDFYDGTKALQFSDTPHAVKMHSWTDRKLPVVLVGAATGNFKYMSVNEDLVDAPIEGSTDTTTRYVYYGGEVHLTMEFAVLATQITERDQIVDILGIYLAHPMAKQYFEQQAVVLPEGPRIGSETEISRPDIDRPIYRTTMSIPVIGVWQDRQEAEDGVEDIWASITAYIEL